MKSDPRNAQSRRARWRLRFLRALGLIIPGTTPTNLLAEDPYDAYYLYLGEYPANANPGWHEDVQGIDHDDDHWFITQTATLWKVPVAHDLSSVSASHPDVLRRSFDDYPVLAGYNHLGDPDVYRYAGSDFLLIPLEGSGVPPVLGVFRCSDLAYVDHVGFPGQSGAGWCAVDGDGFVYSSTRDPTALRLYQLDWDHLYDTGEALLQFYVTIPIFDEWGGPLQLHSMQGGEFAPGDKLLYLVSGYYEDTDPVTEGIHVFDTSSWGRVQHSTNGYGHFNYAFTPGGCVEEEPEGLTIWNLDDGRAPGVSGELHVLMLDNDDWYCDDWSPEDEIYFKHYTGTVYVHRDYVGVERGTPAEPFNTVGEAVALQWEGSKLAIRAGVYPETLTLARRCRVSAVDGPVIVGDLGP